MTRLWLGRLRMHIFHRGDKDPDCHDHPWDFVTFPLTSYVEEVLHPIRDTIAEGEEPKPPRYFKDIQVVRRFRFHFRKAETRSPGFLVLGNGTFSPAGNRMISDRKIVTIVYQRGVRRKWGFIKNREGRWCWEPWKKICLRGWPQTSPVADS